MGIFIDEGVGNGDLGPRIVFFERMRYGVD